MDEWIEREDHTGTQIELFHVFCLAHKIHLAERSSLVPLRTDKDLGPDTCLLYFGRLETLMNAFHTWFKIASRRIAEFRENIMEF